MNEVHFFDAETCDHITTVGLSALPMFAIGSHVRIDHSNPYDVQDVETIVYRIKQVETKINAAALGHEDWFAMKVFVEELDFEKYEYKDATVLKLGGF